jgi:hypothetical protein
MDNVEKLPMALEVEALELFRKRMTSPMRR